MESILEIVAIQFMVKRYLTNPNVIMAGCDYGREVQTETKHNRLNVCIIMVMVK